MDLWILAFWFMILLYVLPIWVFKYFPSQDGPCHIYNSFILKHYSDPEYVFSKFYDVRRFPVPNWASHASMVLLMYIVPPLVAEKILLTGYVVLMAVSMLYLLNAVENRRTPLVFAGFPFIYNFLFLMGFYNFSLGVAMLMLAVGYWWKHSEKFGVKNIVVFTLFLIVLYFCHPVPLVLALFSIGIVAISGLVTNFTRWKQALLTLACMLPSIGLLICYIGTSDMARNPGTWTLSRLWEYFVRNESLAYHSESQIIFGKIVTGVFAILFLYTFVRDHFFTKEWRFCLRIYRKDFFLLLCIIFFAIYLKAPDGLSGGGFIETRMCLLPFLTIIPWFSWKMPKIVSGIAGGALILLSVVYLAHASYYHKILSDDIEVYNSGYGAVERNKVILPLGFDYVGRGWRIGVFVHPLGYYGYNTGCINLINYEATTEYFPTIFKPDFHRPPLAMVHVKQTEIDFAEYKDDIDYILTWALAPKSDVESRILEHYNLIMQNSDLKIFKRAEPK